MLRITLVEPVDPWTLALAVGHLNSEGQGVLVLAPGGGRPQHEMYVVLGEPQRWKRIA
jgi:hypothetical protein